MKPVQWYHAREKQQFGPVSAAELKQLAQAGTLQPGDFVWREGLANWVAAREVRGLFDDQGATPSGAIRVPLSPSNTSVPTPAPTPAPIKNSEPAPAVPSPAPAAAMPATATPPAVKPAAAPVERHLLDPFLDYARGQFSPPFLYSASRLFAAAGHGALYAVMLMVVIFFTAIGLQSEDLQRVLIGLGAALLLAALQYTAVRFQNMFERFRAQGECRLGSTALPDGFALLCIAVGVVALIWLTLLALDWNNYWIALAGLGVFILGEHAAFVALNPAWLGITVTPTARAHEEGVGLFLFLLKTGLCCVPVAFGVQMVLALLALLHACYQVFTGSAELAQTQALLATAFALVSAALPFAAYLVFVTGSLLVEVLRSLVVGSNAKDRTA